MLMRVVIYCYDPGLNLYYRTTQPLLDKKGLYLFYWSKRALFLLLVEKGLYLFFDCASIIAINVVILLFNYNAVFFEVEVNKIRVLIRR